MNYLKLSDVFRNVKNKIIKHNLTIEEISDNTGIKQEMVELYLNPNSNVVDDLSRLIDFTKTGLKQKDYIFRVYSITKEGVQFKITRTIKPECSIVFDKSTQSFYRFSLKYKKHNAISNIHKHLIMSEMKDAIEEYLK